MGRPVNADYDKAYADLRKAGSLDVHMSDATSRLMAGLARRAKDDGNRLVRQRYDEAFSTVHITLHTRPGQREWSVTP